MAVVSLWLVGLIRVTDEGVLSDCLNDWVSGCLFGLVG